jgi:3-oxoacyl-[acyl-carrier protein] reductase
LYLFGPKINAPIVVDLGLANRTAFIAGASSGLGFAVAKTLLEEGCQIAICSRDTHRIEEASASLSPLGEVHPFVCDVTDEQQIEQTMAAAAETFGGKINVLVTNAGGPPAGHIGDFDADDWRRGFELNLVSTINLCRHALPYVRAAASSPDHHGRIIMITSISAKQPIPNLYISNTSRAGVQGFCKSLSEELGPEMITVNTVLPGYTRTQRLGELASAGMAKSGKSVEETFAEWAEMTAMKRLATPDEFAASVAFLASRQAAYITGIALPVDGGRVKGLM